MAEHNDASYADAGTSGRSDDAVRMETLFSFSGVLLQVATATGYGLWMVLGTALALGLYSDGRGEVLAPLALGLVLVSLGLIAACMHLRFAPEWHGWNPLKRTMPTREGMVAMANYLPMLALAGLARGENDFWATRLAGAALMLCSLATLIYTARGVSRRMSVSVASLANVLPLGRTVSAVFAGGLWFWLCVDLQTDVPVDPVSPWRLALLAVALVLGVVEGTRWQALRRLAEERGAIVRLEPGVSPVSLLGRRFAAAALSVGLPCLLLVVHGGGMHASVAGLAALSCVVGQCLEQRLYGYAYAFALDGSKT
ncbi:DMSO reductase anchor subunit DmsC [Luteibacter rhizovicinus]|uniref:DMSO reductase anchor subunit DmsC n=1 Tax=Luteibacter rhizovicinus TaxID=242606 RepID=A0A4R3YMT1_9GAMM|nr:dimethyl sulfoxide reductase anchor subunit [Luteibacter rhizovicinus]TCV92808.1 DMSO reductase anchor subunit DmsC [Luteibacter rhizovicinus]